MRRVALGLGVLTATAGMVVASLYGGLEPGDNLWPITWIAWAPVGALILLRKPGNGVGRAAFAVGLTWGLGFLLLVVAESDLPIVIRSWAEMLQLVLGVVPWMCIILLLLVFPTGRFEGRLESWTGRAVFAFISIGAASFMMSPDPMESTQVPSPLATEWLSWATTRITGDDGFLVVVAFVFVALCALVMRWRRSVGIERVQYRWLFAGAFYFAVVMGLGQFMPEDSPFDFLWLFAGAAIPVVIGIAVLRYGLFDIDRLVSRTVSYTLIIGLLGLVLFGLVAGLGALLGRDNQVVVAVSTLAVAALFNPVRRRVQGGVDRRFNRSRYDAERVMSEFAGSLRDRVDPDGVVEGWVSVVSETMQPSTVGVWMREAEA